VIGGSQFCRRVRPAEAAFNNFEYGCHQTVIETPNSVFGLLRRPEQFWGISVMRVSRTLWVSTAISSILASVSASADSSSAISYVPHSLSEAVIAGGPWTLHQTGGKNSHDASGIMSGVKTPYNPPTTAYGTPYKGYCTGGRVQGAEGVNPMQPYYFPFVRGSDDHLEGFSITARATSRKRPSPRFRTIGARAGVSRARRWGSIRTARRMRPIPTTITSLSTG